MCRNHADAWHPRGTTKSNADDYDDSSRDDREED
jgi:hypothetical protein